MISHNLSRVLKFIIWSSLFITDLAFAVGANDIGRNITQTIQSSTGRTVGEAVGRNVQYQLIKPRLSIRDPAGEIEHMAVSSDGKLLVVVLADESVRLWDMELGIQRFKAMAPLSRYRVVALTPDGKFVIAGCEDGTLRLLDASTGEENRVLRGHRGAIKALAVSEDGSLLVSSASDGSVRSWDFGNHRMLRQFDVAEEIIALAISPDHEKLLTGDSFGNSRLWDLKSGKETATLGKYESPVFSVKFVQRGARTAAVARGRLGLLDADKVSGPARAIPIPSLSSFAGTENSNLAAVGTDDGVIRLIDMASDRIIKEFKGHRGAVRHLVYDDTKHRIISASDDGIMRLFNADTGEELLQVIMTRNGWVVLDPHGRFDGSEQGMSDVSWRAGKTDLPLNRFGKFFEPGLMAAYLTGSGTALKPVAGKIQDGIALPPKIEIEFPEGPYDATKSFAPIVVVATDQGGGIGDLRLYHNGKLVDPGAMLKQQEVEEGGKHLRAAAFMVKPIAGINTFRATGSGLWDIEGYSEKITQNFLGPEPASTLHVVTVGIGRYADARLNLDYTVADATAMAIYLKNAKGIFKDVREYRLLDQEGTKDNILRTLDIIKDQAEPNDVVAVYLAGHGLVVGDEWRFLPYETRYQSNIEHYANQGVTASMLQDSLVKAKSHRILLLIDACQSGATTQTFSEQQQFQRRFFRDMSRVAGVTVLAAARKDQEAAEIGKLGHGLFTYILLTGLEGKADIKPRDGSVTAHEVVEFASQTIPNFSQRYINYRQEPSAFALGADFKIAQVTGKNK